MDPFKSFKPFNRFALSEKHHPSAGLNGFERLEQLKLLEPR